ncbi:MAG: ammonia-forming cytochrome c nitrite reductase subunit c552 [Phycisphaerae bacterium]|jgi:nitrite reductase (cytochrome c-552)|nr:ammonia-forming cytochrome c nitrite reductase subunit c552 [Phycisphaerae bacterium]
MGTKLLFGTVLLVSASMTLGAMWLHDNIEERKAEGHEVAFRVGEISEETVDPAVWGKTFPRQYDSYKRTSDIAHTRYGGSEAISKVGDGATWTKLWAGYPFSVDYREERGHAYMLVDQRETERVKQFKQPGACLHCHASVIPAYYKKGVDAGAPANDRQAAIMKGFEEVCRMPYSDATALVEHPVSCGDCHDPSSMALRVTRPGFLNGIAALAESDEPLVHLESINRWRGGSRSERYDPNALASRQEMRTFVCAQCHVEYHFAGEKKLVTYPWSNGIEAEDAERYYDEIGWKDFTHATTGTPVLKAQHPEFELWNRGVHAASGVACADCHMPYVREGAIKVSSHHVRSPLLDVNRSCQTCHRQNEVEIQRRVTEIQDRTRHLMDRAEAACLDVVAALEAAKSRVTDDAALGPARKLHRAAQWRLDYVNAENSMGFHAPGEALRLLGESIDLARQGVTEAERLGRGDRRVDSQDSAEANAKK